MSGGSKYIISHQALRLCAAFVLLFCASTTAHAAALTCNADYEGVLIYNQDRGGMEYCNGTYWTEIGSPKSPAELPTDGLVGHWDFEDGAGTTATDNAGSNNGTLTNMDSSTDWVTGKIGDYALDFDGSDDCVNIGSDSSLKPTSAITISAWVKPDTVGSYPRIVSYDQGGLSYNGYYLRINSDGATNFQAGLSTDTRMDSAADGLGNAPNLGTWQHVAMTYDGTSTKLYEDGVEVDEDTGVNGNIDYTSTTIGAIGCRQTSGNYFDGQIDDVRLYGRALSSSEIANIYSSSGVQQACTAPDGAEGELSYNYTQGTIQYCARSGWINAGPTIGSAGTETATAPTSGLIAKYTFEDGSGTTLTDSAGSANGTLANMDDTDWVAGIQGTALDFDGSNDQITLSDAALPMGSSPRTFSAWFKPAKSALMGIFGYGINSGQQASGLFLRSGGEISMYAWDNDLNAGNYTTGSWVHVVGTFDGTTAKIYKNGTYVDSMAAGTWNTVTNGNTFYIGAVNGGGYRYQGLIDNIYIYDRALDANEVQNLYEATGGASSNMNDYLVAKYTFDEGNGTTLTDSSGNGYNGTLTNMDATTDWVDGIMGGALDFDGSNDYVALPNSADLQDLQEGDYTLAAWYNPDVTPTGSGSSPTAAHTVIAKQGYNNGLIFGWEAADFEMNHWITGNTGNPAGRDSGANLQADQWHHVTGVVDKTAGTVKMYVDGVLSDTANFTPGTAAREYGTMPWTIGTSYASTSTNYAWVANGQIDNVYMYSKALSDAEVTALYKGTGGSTNTLETCASPDGIEGEIIYNDDLNKMQFCGPGGWVEMR